MKLNLKAIREQKLNITQQELSEKLMIPLEEVKGIENGELKLQFESMQPLCALTGLDYNQLFGYVPPKPKGISPNDNWENVEFTKNNLVKYIKQAEGAKTDFANEINILDTYVKHSMVKPKISFAGQSDSGKSTLINSLLGVDKMPAKWTPTTSIVVYIKHINDRPDFITDDVWVFKSIDNEDWDDSRLDDESYCNQFKIANGDIGLLESYGTHQEESGNSDVTSSVVFVDSDILIDCDLMDLPGFGTGTFAKDDKLGQIRSANKKTDVLIYMSRANGFLHDADITYLKSCLDFVNPIENENENSLKPLNNIFIVASQAKTVNEGNMTELNEILDRRSEAFWNTLPEEVLSRRSIKTRYKYTKQDVRNRFFTYETSIPVLRECFENEVKNLIEKYPEEIERVARKEIKNIQQGSTKIISNKIAEFQNIIDEREKYKKLYSEIILNEPSRKDDNINKISEIHKLFEKLNSESIRKFNDEYHLYMNKEELAEIMKNKGVKNKKDDIQEFASFVNNTLLEKLRTILSDASIQSTKAIDLYVADYQNSITKYANNVGIKNINISFNAAQSFAAGIAGMAAFGAMSSWIAGTTSFLLTSMLGSLAGVGPILLVGGMFTIAIGVAIASVFGIMAMFNMGWQKKVAEKIISQFEKETYLDNMKTEIIKYWSDTKKGFDNATDKLDIDWKEYVEQINQLADEKNIDGVIEKIEKAKDVKDFFENIPL